MPLGCVPSLVPHLMTVVVTVVVLSGERGEKLAHCIRRIDPREKISILLLAYQSTNCEQVIL